MDTDPSICLDCGLCCDGTLHNRVTVRAEDEAAVRAIDLIIVTGRKAHFRQPCTHFRDGACGVYDVRPGVCRTYRCALLESVEGGAINRLEALDKIQTAKSLRAAVLAGEPTAVTPQDRTELVRRLRDRLIRSTGEARNQIAAALLEIGLFEHFIAKWFLKQDRTAQERPDRR